MTGNLFARKTWFTADLHLGHKRIIELCDRPFATVAEMDAAIVERWNERVDPDDTVFVLGDFAKGDVTESLPLVRTLHGRKVLVAGNHDPCFHGFKGHAPGPADLARWVAAYRDAGFSSVVTGRAMLKRAGRPVAVSLRPEFGADPVALVHLSHFPRTGESMPGRADRYPQYRPRLKAGAWLIHGHVHNAWTVNGRQVNVGVDVWDFAPVSSETLISIVQDGMPECACGSPNSAHPAGAPGCVINGG